jgi:urease accessory protein
MTPYRFLHRTLAGACAGLGSAAALAHHPMDGQTPTTVLEGLLSGLAHPVIDPVHLLFLLGAAALAGLTAVPLRRALAGLSIYLLASTLATGLNIAEAPTQVLSLGLAASLLALVPWLWRRQWPRAATAAPLAALAGAVHGLAFAETVIGAEPTPLFAYLLGLALVQAGLMAGLCIVLKRAVGPEPQRLAQCARALAGGMLAAAFVFGLAAA